ncbi:unnamed protein product [Hermetia illucens]|uniref:Uncharacterized protein n=1 Tax=Hermetia illucens TaxID=343691 RepID=A0A7R8UQ14_HERIL|nr:cecropin-1-like [Hermetia illucens]CAD7084680.1 unnamed protein product [Hermetia illucens]
MNFKVIFVVIAIVMVALCGQTEARWYKKIFKPVEKAVQRVRDGTLQALGVAQQAANVYATAQGAQQQRHA